MASLGTTIDPTQTPRTEPEARDPLPAGTEVLMHAVQTDVKPTQKGGTGINIRDEVIDGPHKGHPVFSFINISNPSAQAQAIGQSELANRCDACGLGTISDSDELLYRPFRAVLGVKPGQNGYGPKNFIRKYIPKDGAPAAPVAQPHGGAPALAAAASTPASTGGRRPWDN